MREIIEYNLNQLKRLYSAPLLSVHLNMIDGLDDLKIMEECILVGMNIMLHAMPEY